MQWSRLLEVFVAFTLVNNWEKVFAVVVGKVVKCFALVNTELVLANAITDPVEKHVHGFGMALFDSVSPVCKHHPLHENPCVPGMTNTTVAPSPKPCPPVDDPCQC